jgi:hypothetical protein
VLVTCVVVFALVRNANGALRIGMRATPRTIAARHNDPGWFLEPKRRRKTFPLFYRSRANTIAAGALAEAYALIAATRDSTGIAGLPDCSTVARIRWMRTRDMWP